MRKTIIILLLLSILQITSAYINITYKDNIIYIEDKSMCEKLKLSNRYMYNHIWFYGIEYTGDNKDIICYKSQWVDSNGNKRITIQIIKMDIEREGGWKNMTIIPYITIYSFEYLFLNEYFFLNENNIPYSVDVSRTERMSIRQFEKSDIYDKYNEDFWKLFETYYRPYVDDFYNTKEIK